MDKVCQRRFSEFRADVLVEDCAGHPRTGENGAFLEGTCLEQSSQRQKWFEVICTSLVKAWKEFTFFGTYEVRTWIYPLKASTREEKESYSNNPKGLVRNLSSVERRSCGEQGGNERMCVDWEGLKCKGM